MPALGSAKLVANLGAYSSYRTCRHRTFQMLPLRGRVLSRLGLVRVQERAFDADVPGVGEGRDCAHH